MLLWLGYKAPNRGAKLNARFIKMGCTHSAAMAVLGSAGHDTARTTLAKGTAAGRLLRAFAVHAEMLCRLRSGGSQLTHVEQVHVNEGGQAIIGSVAPAVRR